MTAPIQEPNTDRALQGMAYARDQIFRRPAPVASAGLPYCWGRWIGSEAVPADTLFDPVSGPAPDVPYEEASIYDPDGLAGFSFDLDSGCLSWDNAGEYYIWCGAQWNGTGSAGETLGTVITYGSGCSFFTDRAVAMIVADPVNQNMYVPVDRMISDFNTGSVAALVYHTDAGGNDLGAVYLHAVQISPVLGEFFT